MSEKPVVLVGLDGSPDSDTALAWALEVAAARGSSVEAVRAWQWETAFLGIVVPQAPVDVAVAARHAVEAQLEKVVAGRAPGTETVDARARAVEADPATAVLADSDAADLLVLGRHGHSAWQRLLTGPVLGSVTSACLNRARCPVAVVPPGTPPAAPARVVVGIDGSGPSRRALAWAAQHAAAVGAPVVAVLAWQLTSLPAPATAREGWAVPPLTDWEALGRDLLAEVVGDLPGVEQRLIHRPAAAGLLETVRAGDLLVLGERGLGGFARLLLGSVSRQCVEHAPCPVVVVPPRDRSAG